MTSCFKIPFTKHENSKTRNDFSSELSWNKYIAKNILQIIILFEAYYVNEKEKIRNSQFLTFSRNFSISFKSITFLIFLKALNCKWIPELLMNVNFTAVYAIN